MRANKSAMRLQLFAAQAERHLLHPRAHGFVDMDRQLGRSLDLNMRCSPLAGHAFSSSVVSCTPIIPSLHCSWTPTLWSRHRLSPLRSDAAHPRNLASSACPLQRQGLMARVRRWTTSRS